MCTSIKMNRMKNDTLRARCSPFSCCISSQNGQSHRMRLLHLKQHKWATFIDCEVKEWASEESLKAIWNTSSRIIWEKLSIWNENKWLPRAYACFYAEPRTPCIKTKAKVFSKLLSESHLQPQSAALSSIYEIKQQALRNCICSSLYLIACKDMAVMWFYLSHFPNRSPAHPTGAELI